MLVAAVGNLLQNAFKVTKHRTSVALNAYGVADRIRIDVEDCCGGLRPGGADRMFLLFKQCGGDGSGLGLGLAICRRSVQANNGVLSVRDVPGVGCVFTIDLPRHSLPQTCFGTDCLRAGVVLLFSLDQKEHTMSHQPPKQNKKKAQHTAKEKKSIKQQKKHASEHVPFIKQ